jgi:hypothetical protein
MKRARCFGMIASLVISFALLVRAANPITLKPASSTTFELMEGSFRARRSAPSQGPPARLRPGGVKIVSERELPYRCSASCDYNLVRKSITSGDVQSTELTNLRRTTPLRSMTNVSGINTVPYSALVLAEGSRTATMFML